MTSREAVSMMKRNPRVCVATTLGEDFGPLRAGSPCVFRYWGYGLEVWDSFRHRWCLTGKLRHFPEGVTYTRVKDPAECRKVLTPKAV